MMRLTLRRQGVGLFSKIDARDPACAPVSFAGGDEGMVQNPKPVATFDVPDNPRGIAALPVLSRTAYPGSNFSWPDWHIMKRLEFVVHGPFRVPAETPRAGPELLLDGFWDEGTLATLRKHCGVYVFALRRVKGRTAPQYVGLTQGRFDKEVFNRSNLVKYRNAMAKAKRGKPVLFLIVPPHGKGKVSRKYIGELENFLIQARSARNPDFRNVKGVPRPKWLIRGVTGRRVGKPPMPAQKLREAMGIG